MVRTDWNRKLALTFAFTLILSVTEKLPIFRALQSIDESSLSREKVKSKSAAPRQVRSRSPTRAPTAAPTAASTTASTTTPTRAPTAAPTAASTTASTTTPTTAPTALPTAASTTSPTTAPTTATVTRAKAKSKTTTKKAAMCSIVINEEVYLDEFVDYHHALGFDKFLIYDNSKNFEMKQWGKLKGDHVEVIHFPGDTKQMPAYIDCGKKLAETGEYEWAAFFDADEYLVLKKHEHVADMLEEHCSWGALVINWLVFESNGWNLQALEPVTRRFQYHLAWDHPVQNHVKSIVRLADVKELAWNDPHNFANVKEGSTVHDSNGKPVKGPFNTDKPRDVVVIHHYHTKSRKEYVAKRNRGRSDVVPTRSEDKEAARETLKLAEEDLASSLAGEDLPMDTKHFEEQGLVFDDSAWQFLKSHVSAYALFDEIGLIKTNESRRKI